MLLYLPTASTPSLVCPPLPHTSHAHENHLFKHDPPPPPPTSTHLVFSPSSSLPNDVCQWPWRAAVQRGHDWSSPLTRQYRVKRRRSNLALRQSHPLSLLRAQARVAVGRKEMVGVSEKLSKGGSGGLLVGCLTSRQHAISGADLLRQFCVLQH